MSLGYIAIAATIVGAAYTADQNRKARHEVADAQRDADTKDAVQKAELETSTALAANARFAADKRARQANVLALGGASTPLGGSASPTGANGVPIGTGLSAAAPGASAPNVLGSGAAAGGTVGGAGSLRTIGGSGGAVRPGGAATY